MNLVETNKEKETIQRRYEYCITYFKKLNTKQVNALWEYLKITNTKTDRTQRFPLMKKNFGKLAVIKYLTDLRDNINNGYEYSALVAEDLFSIWHVIIGMLLMQDEYNKYNPNYKSKIN